MTANALHARRDRDARQAGAQGERPIANARAFAVFGKCYALQAGAILERMTANALHARWDRDARQAGATFERTRANARHALRDRDARQAGATGERQIANARHASICRYNTVFASQNQCFG